MNHPPFTENHQRLGEHKSWRAEEYVLATFLWNMLPRSRKWYQHIMFIDFVCILQYQKIQVARNHPFLQFGQGVKEHRNMRLEALYPRSAVQSFGWVGHTDWERRTMQWTPFIVMAEPVWLEKKKSSIELFFTSVTSTENKVKKNESNECRLVSLSFHIDGCNWSIFFSVSKYKQKSVLHTYKSDGVN